MGIEHSGVFLSFLVKHFYPGLIGWEEKDKRVEFMLVDSSDDPKEVVFLEQNKENAPWLIYRATSQNSIEAYFEKENELLNEKDKFTFTRSTL
jgi:hypothetical protein